jgi:hypothetical protein
MLNNGLWLGYGAEKIPARHIQYSALDHGIFFLLWNVVVEISCYTGHRNDCNLWKRAIAGCLYIVLPSTPSGSQHSVAGLNKFTSPSACVVQNFY